MTALSATPVGYMPLADTTSDFQRLGDLLWFVGDSIAVVETEYPSPSRVLPAVGERDLLSRVGLTG